MKLKMRVYYFEKMRVWQNAHNLNNDIYAVTRSFPKDEEFHLKQQMRRASSSVKSNIAEGQGRSPKKDQAHFTTMSYSSLTELLNHLLTARDQFYIEEESYFQLREKIEQIGNQLNALKRTQLSKM